MLARRGFPVNGFAVGILCLETRHALLRGNVQHAQSFSRPVLYETIPLADPWPLMNGAPELTELIADHALKLEKMGVDIIVGACGSFAYYQQAVAARTSVPTLLSVMCHTNLILQALPPRKKLAVICAASSAINQRIYDACEISATDRLVVREMLGHCQFDRMLKAEAFDQDALRAELISVGQSALANNPDIGAFLLQCSDLPPFSSDLRQATGKPVFDMVLLIEWLAAAARGE